MEAVQVKTTFSHILKMIFVLGPMKPLGDLLVFDLDSFSWEKVKLKGDPILPRFKHTMLFLSYLNSLFIFGGVCLEGSKLSPCDSAFLIDVSSWEVKKVEIEV